MAENTKYDSGREVFYRPVGDYVVVARNSRKRMAVARDSDGRSHEVMVREPEGLPFVMFANEREFSDGTICLEEENSVAGGVNQEQIPKIIQELRDALALIGGGLEW